MGLILHFFFPIVIIGVGIKNHLYVFNLVLKIKIFSAKNTPNSGLKWITGDMCLIRVLGKRLPCGFKSIFGVLPQSCCDSLCLAMENNIQLISS